MSEQSQVTCPECNTAQSADAPFCENCGYRIRRSDTVKEGHQAVTPEILRQHHRQRRAKPSTQWQSNRAEHPGSDSPDGTDTPEGMPPAPPKNDGPQTFIEGLHRVDLDEDTSASDDSAESDEFHRRSPVQSGLYDHPQQAQRRQLVVYGAIWLSLTAVAVLATYFLATSASDQPPVDDAASQPSKKLEVPAGPYKRGLDDEVRSFILQMCMKVEEDSREACKQDKLLKGEYPQKTVELDAFKVDSKEVTVARYRQCVEDGDCAPIGWRDCEVWTHQGLQVALRVPQALQAPQMPVTCISLEQARAFCEWAGGTVPTPDQWEKAARGKEAPLFPWGNSWSSDIVNWGEMDVARNPIIGQLDGHEWTAPPGSFPKGKSPYGAYDMAGNVAEWVDTEQKLGAQARGGSWTSNPFDLRTTHRLGLDRSDRRTDVGFRCVYR